MTNQDKLLPCSLLAVLLLLPLAAPAAELTVRQNDPHYTKTGFFDLHVCNWPDRQPFFLGVFSTYYFDDLVSVEIFSPDGKAIGSLDKQRFRLIRQKGKPEKRAFIKQFTLPENARDGWYSATATRANGRKVHYRDYVILDRMPWAGNAKPAPGAEDIPVPKQLSWDKIPGANYYQVFIKDLWQDGKVIYTSKLLTEPKLAIKPGLLEADGWYEWRVHARDVNEHILLGDFNQGSLSPVMKFTTGSEK